MKYRMRDLENFALTVDCATMGEAARKLRISQPALSESIQRLEEDLGSSVFYRSRAGIQLTPIGRVFLKKVSRLLSSVQNLEIEANEQSVFGGQSISVGCHLTVASYTLPKALLKLKESAPDFRIELKHDFSRNIQMEIQKGRLDLGIVVNPVRVPDIVVSRLGFDLVSVWSKAGQFSTDTLIYNPNLLQSQSLLKKWSNRPRKTIETDGLELICRLTAKGLGYGIIPTQAVELSNEPLVAVKSLPTFRDEIALVYRPEFGKTLAERALITAIKSAF
jgi:DNA-binding transcriptional LysR family regulator